MANYQQLKAAIDQVIKTNGHKEITGPVLNNTLKTIVNTLGAGYQFVGVATPSTNPGTPDQNVFYLAGQAGTYTNFNNIVLPNGVSVIKWNGSWSSETVVAGDGVFDISAYKAIGGTLATFAELSAALDGGNNIPQSLRKGGMSVKFVQSSDNKYVQYRLMADEWSTNTEDWYNETISVSDNTLIVNDKEVGELSKFVENPEFIKVFLDSDGKIFFSIDRNQIWKIFGHVVANSFNAPRYTIEDSVISCDETSEFSFVILDKEERILFGISRNDGSICGKKSDAQSFGEMYVKKTSSTMDIYLRHEQNLYIHYIMSHRQKEYVSGTNSFYDNWGVDRVALSSFDGESFSHIKYLYRDGELEQAIEINNDGTYQWVGGAYHGYEQIRSVDDKRRIYFIIDGNYIEESDSFELRECSYINIYQQSDIYEYDTTTDSFGIVFKEWKFENGELTLTTSVDFIKSLRIRTIAGSMMCVYRHDEGDSSKPYLTDKAIKNNEPFVIYDLKDGHSSVAGGANCKEMTEYGSLGFSFGMKIIDGTKMHSSGTLHIIEDVSNYNKIYGYTMRALGTGTDVLSGTQYGLITKQIIK